MKRLRVLLSALVLFSLLPSGLYAQAARSSTEIKVRLLDRLDTGATPTGRAFSATIEEPVRLDKKIVLARGTTVSGRVTEVVSSGRLKRPASITLQLTSLGSTPIHTEPLQIDGNSHAGRNTALIGGGAAAGAILGGIAGGGKGAIIGTAVGAGAGTGTAYATGKQEIVLPSETELTFEIAGSVPPPPAVASSNASDQKRWRDDSSEEAYGNSEVSSGSDRNFFVGISIGPPPPPRVVYVEPSRPGREFVWVKGYWYPVGGRYQWHEGYWTRPPYEGAHWVEPHHDGGRFFMGYWEGDRGRVVHDPHWDDDHDRDHDRDYERHDHDRDDR